MMRFLPLLLWLPLAALAQPHLEIDARLDPATRQLDVRATLTSERALRGFRLGREFEITSASANGRPLALASRPASADFSLPAGTRKLEIAYRATLPPTAALDHRQVLGRRGGAAGPEGSFLPAGAGWYPDPGALFSYRLALSLPPGQKGLVPGT
ncbi:MAG: hypothetical protein KGZ43_03940, partial [Sulfuritalea sp.]|nr:hypothetical protein [Sulfuritalea sp.]